jgi:predicted ATP-grasp superfamily ATP-dependent carboligase
MVEVLVVGLSARALSQSARAAGHLPLAADLFCDLDTQDAAERSVRIDCDLERGFEWAPLATALETLAAGREPVGIACGSGFEDRPDLLDRLAERWPLLGNVGDTVARVTNPAGLAELCERCRIPHPRWSSAPQGLGWLSKQVGGAGGSHVGSEGQGENRFWQERVDGEPVSALILANGDGAIVLGFSTQWSDPSPNAPFRYGGAARPAHLSPETEAALADAARKIAEAARLVGLNSVDFLVSAEGWHLIEVNPRPGATLDIFRPAVGSLFALHVEACRGRLPSSSVPAFAGAAAARIIYASRDVTRVPKFAWPDWAADRQPPGTALRVGAPVCTVLAEASTPAEARRLVEARGKTVAAALGAG